ncbi:hypothetical protein GQ607_012043 [Colletotrichum asianum]|uniref:Uncharacterized protein n=1 Tax=Colletotrichum asianum TaxID=702518 RepID=A0A8H3W7M5_9PEZI|nr:hypothetical protein GQ607_012043 [Colletotrichum asianum]
MRRWRGAQMSQSVRKQRRHQRGTWKKGASATQEGMDCDGKRGHSWNGRLHVPDRDPCPGTPDPRPRQQRCLTVPRELQQRLFWLAAAGLSAVFSAGGC